MSGTMNSHKGMIGAQTSKTVTGSHSHQTTQPMKITATIPPQVVVLPQGNHLLSSMTKLRNSETATKEFFDAFEIVSSQLIASALDSLPTEAVDVVTPTGGIFKGTKQVTHVCGVSILRAGASFETVLRNLYTGPLSFGKILIQRNEETSLPYHLYSNFPRGVAEMTVFLLEPMLATGASACMAVDKVRASGVPERNIVFVNLLASREGLSILTTRHPEMHVVTAAIDEELTASKHITPGLGDFGDRFYGTSN